VIGLHAPAAERTSCSADGVTINGRFAATNGGSGHRCPDDRAADAAHVIHV
jgi:hypothetical protein